MSYVITNAKKFVAHSVGKQPVQGEYAAFKPENAGPFQSTWRLFIFGPNGSEVAEYPSEKLLLSALRKIAGDSLKIQSISTLTIEQRDKAIAAGVHSSQMPPTASRSGENFDSKARLDAAKQAMIDAGQQSAGSPEALRAQLKQQQQRAQTPAQALAMTPEQEAIENIRMEENGWLVFRPAGVQ